MEAWIVYLLDHPWVSARITPVLFDTDLAAVEDPFVGIGERSRSDRVGTGRQVGAQSVGVWYYPLSAAYTYE